MRRHGTDKTQGYTLVEVLVALLVFSVGILSAAGMISTAHINNRNANFYTVAVGLMQQMGEKMRANAMGITNGNYNNVTSASMPGSRVDCSAGCDPATIATNDIFDWYTGLNSDLPMGDGTVSVQNGRLVVTVMWDPDRGYTNATSCTSNPPLQCISMEVQ